jgi:circadian clock protein KaiC
MEITKIPTGIEGVDDVMRGGLPLGRTTLVAGSAGSAKTIFAVQFIRGGIADGEAGVFVTFEESPEDIRRNTASLGWDVETWEQEGRFAFVDVSPIPEQETIFAGDFDLGALMTRIEHAVRRTGATRVALDSLGAVFSHFDDSRIVRKELRRIASALRQMQVTAVMTAEREEEYGAIARFGIEEFVADNVVILRNVLDEENRRRTIEVLKFRGTPHMKGEYPFTIADERGMIAIPLSAIELQQPSSNVRASSGSVELDRMLGGGFFRDSIILVSGATGTGKTLTAMHFIAGGLQAGEKVLFLAFEESREQLFRNAIGWGFDLESHEREGRLKVICHYPEIQSLEDHLLDIKDSLRAFGPKRVAIDSLSALERVGTVRSFREFVIGVTSAIKHLEIAGLFTNSTPTLLGGTSVTEAHISTITDTIILLRYAEIFGRMRRGITVLKMRGSLHDKDIREFSIDQEGMHIGRPFRNVGGILAGNPVQLPQAEIDRVAELFSDEAEGG